MADMKDALMGKSLSDYLTINGSGSWNPGYSKDQNDVRKRGFNFSGDAQANIPIDPLVRDAILHLIAGGFGYGGSVKLPQEMQEMGAPAKIKYGDSGLSNLGVGLSQGDLAGDLSYNPQTQDYGAGFSNGGFSANLGYNPETDNRSLYARYKVDF